MKSIQQIIQYSGLLLLLLVFSSCSSQPPQKVEEIPLSTSTGASTPMKKAQPVDSTTLPVEYQKPAYVVGNEQGKSRMQDDKELGRSDVAIKVGASIHSTVGPQPLRDIIKRLAALKGMNVSWASDVDQNALVDVDINANDDFSEAVDHLLRQINYFHEVKENTLIIKNKETRQFHIAMPFITQAYSTDTGGDVLGGNKDTTTFKGKIGLTATGSPVGTSVGSGKDDTKKTEFDAWQNIESNLKVILDILETTETTVTSQEREFGGTGQSSNSQDTSAGGNASANGKSNTGGKTADAGKSVKTSRQTSKTGAYFTIDKPVGIITVTATRDLLDRVDNYLTSLQKQMYKQINIEAKIIEVQLNDSSNMGVDWSKMLSPNGSNPLTLTGQPIFGNGGQVFPTNTGATSQFISSFTLNASSFNILLSALKDVGDTKVLSNPKISVLNGQPAFISVGRNTAYISKVTSTQTTGSTNNTVTFTVDTSSILSGVGLALTANVMDDNEVVMNLVPVVSRLLNGVVQTVQIGTSANGAQVGLPVVDVREMSTTVKVKNGDMLVIGGLIDNTDQNDKNSVPLLGDIPLVKYLFGSSSKAVTKKELIILLKPTII
ncbi:MAG: pilus (MSHA type) biogenesis protein MshL [Desulfocapsaceae bacterium]|nr:pilus (MSHA type) biogenesis protein MshL [Desulfocapsaceae bacterium]